jgi:hypothetical protein
MGLEAITRRYESSEVLFTVETRLTSLTDCIFMDLKPALRVFGYGSLVLGVGEARRGVASVLNLVCGS